MLFTFRPNGRPLRPFPKDCRSLLLCVCIATAFVASCSRSSDSSRTIKIEHEISPTPAQVGPTVITFQMAGPDSKAIAGAHVAIEADMAHAGMAPVFADAQEIGSGRYQARLTFGMAGDWVILLHVVLPDGQKLERQFNVSGVRPN